MSSAGVIVIRLMVPVVFATSVLLASAQQSATDVQCAKQARQLSSEKLTRLVVRREPVTPPSMERLSIRGTITLRVCVNAEGKVFSAAVIDGNPMARQAVLEAVQKWQFKPYRHNGRLETVVADLCVDYDFRSLPQANHTSVSVCKVTSGNVNESSFVSIEAELVNTVPHGLFLLDRRCAHKGLQIDYPHQPSEPSLKALDEIIWDTRIVSGTFRGEVKCDHDTGRLYLLVQSTLNLQRKH